VYITRRQATLVVLLLHIIYFFPAVIGEVILAPGDGWSQNFPARVYAGELLRHG
jgi:hypothetical protein